MNIVLVCIDAHALTYTRYINRCRDVKVRAESPMTASEIEEFRVNPGACVDGYMPPEPKRA